MAERTKMSVTGRTAVKVTLVLLTGLAWCCQPGAAMATDSKPAAAYERKIERLVADLGADSYLVREQAQAELVKIGSPAIQALARALDSDDLEVVQRAEKALAEIRKHAAEQADRRIKRNLLWEVQLRSGLDGSPAVVGDTVFFSGTAGGLQAVDARIGKRLWEFGTKPGCSFLAAGGKVYAANREGQLHSLDAKTGKVDAKFRAEALAGAPALADGVIHALSTKGAVLALDADTGRTKWRAEVGALGGGLRPVVGEKAVYVAAADGKLIALDRATGKKVWLTVQSGSHQALGLHSGRVFVRRDDRIHAHDAKTGQLLWQSALPGVDPARAAFRQFQAKARIVLNGKQAAFALPLVGDSGLTCSMGTIYLAAGDRLVALDGDTGRQKWAYEPELEEQDEQQLGEQVIRLGGRGQQARVMIQALVRAHMVAGLGLRQLTDPVIDGGVLYFGSRQGLHAVDLKTRQPLWTFETPNPVTGRPVVANGVIYFGTAAGTVPGGQKPELTQAHLYAVRLKGEN